MNKTGVVDVGGGLRGAYAAGVLDWCMDNGIEFDVGVGVSAGSANIASYMARQPRRNLRFYTEYPRRRAYMGVCNFLRRHSFLNLDYIYSALSNSDGECPLDYPMMRSSRMEYYAVATNANNGKARYFGINSIRQDQYDVFKASSAIPYVCRPVEIAGIPYYDGALSDPVPIQFAFGRGCGKVVLILTCPRDQRRSPDRDLKLARRIRKEYPNAAAELKRRAEKYNKGIVMAEQYEAEGKLLIVAPDDTCGVKTLTRDVDALNRLYQKGYNDGAAIRDFLRSDKL